MLFSTFLRSLTIIPLKSTRNKSNCARANKKCPSFVAASDDIGIKTCTGEKSRTLTDITVKVRKETTAKAKKLISRKFSCEVRARCSLLLFRKNFSRFHSMRWQDAETAYLYKYFAFCEFFFFFHCACSALSFHWWWCWPGREKRKAFFYSKINTWIFFLSSFLRSFLLVQRVPFGMLKLLFSVAMWKNWLLKSLIQRNTGKRMLGKKMRNASGRSWKENIVFFTKRIFFSISCGKWWAVAFHWLLLNDCLNLLLLNWFM